jgi:hypothetical protein
LRRTLSSGRDAGTAVTAELMGSGRDGGSLTGLVFWLKGLEVVWLYLYTIELHSNLCLALLSPQSALKLDPQYTPHDTTQNFSRNSLVVRATFRNLLLGFGGESR